MWSSLEKPPFGAALVRTPWLCAYCPVRKDERDGQQSERVTKLLSNVVPCRPISASVLRITRISSTVWSSVSITTRFGRGLARAAWLSIETIEPATASATRIAVARLMRALTPHMVALEDGADARFVYEFSNGGAVRARAELLTGTNFAFLAELIEDGSRTSRRSGSTSRATSSS